MKVLSSPLTTPWCWIACREPNRTVAQLVAHVDRREQLLGRELSTGHAGADHERNLPLALLAIDGLAGLTVVLLVGAVVLEQLDGGLAEPRRPVGEFLGDVAGEVVARDFGQLDGRGLGGGGGRGNGLFVCHDGRAGDPGENPGETGPERLPAAGPVPVRIGETARRDDTSQCLEIAVDKNRPSEPPCFHDRRRRDGGSHAR
jgi:hypothetical protein